MEPVNPAGYLRGLSLTDPRYRRSWLRRCQVQGCQRKRRHAGEHYRRRRWPRRFWAWTDDAPFGFFEKREIRG